MQLRPCLSSIVNEVIRKIVRLFFFRKKFWTHKNAKTNQQNKNKTTKINRGNKFSRTKTSKRGKIVYFAFLKKIETVLIISFTILLKIFDFWLCYYYQIACTCLSLLARLVYHYSYYSWPNRQDKRLLTHATFENTGSTPMRGRFHGCWTLTVNETLGI